jgi:hypothetical protein
VLPTIGGLGGGGNHRDSLGEGVAVVSDGSVDARRGAEAAVALPVAIRASL